MKIIMSYYMIGMSVMLFVTNQSNFRDYELYFRNMEGGNWGCLW